MPLLLHRCLWAALGLLAVLWLPNVGWAQPIGLEQEGRLQRERVEGLPDARKPGVRLPPPDLEFRSDTLRFQPRELDILPGLELPNAQAAPLPRPMWDRLYVNHLKAGIGRWFSPLVQLYIADGLRGRNPRLGWELDYRHFSSAQGHLKNANFGDNSLLLKGRYYLDRHTLGAHIRFRHNTFRHFGDTAAARLPEWPDSLRQRFSRLEVLASAARNHDPAAFNYNADVRVRTYSERTDNREFHFSILPSASYAFNQRLGFAATSELTYSNLALVGLNNAERGQFFFDLAPALTLNLPIGLMNLTGRAGFRVGTFSNGDTSMTRIFPLVAASLPLLADSVLHVFVNVGGQTHYNTRYGLVDQNPYIAPAAIVLPTQEVLRAEAGVRGHLGRVNYSVRGYLSSADLQPVFFSPPRDTFTPGLPDSGAYFPDQGRFHVLYENRFSAVGAVLDVSYTWQERVNAGASFQFAKYTLKDLKHFFGMPGTQIALYGGYKFAEKAAVRSRLNVIGPRPIGLDADGNLIRENIFLDLNLTGEYFLSPRVSFFLEANNLLNMEYYRWQGYRERGLDVRIGGTLSF